MQVAFMKRQRPRSAPSHEMAYFLHSPPQYAPRNPDKNPLCAAHPREHTIRGE